MDDDKIEVSLVLRLFGDEEYVRILISRHEQLPFHISTTRNRSRIQATLELIQMEHSGSDVGWDETHMKDATVLLRSLIHALSNIDESACEADFQLHLYKTMTLGTSHITIPSELLAEIATTNLPLSMSIDILIA